MDKSKTVFDYIAKVFTAFGLTVAVLLLFSFSFGDMAKDVSSMFSLGADGLSLATLAQFFLLCVLTVFLRFLFLTDKIIHGTHIVFRKTALITSVTAFSILFIIIFDWFPTGQLSAWLGFGVSFTVCLILSLLGSSYQERLKNKKMAEALEKIKREA